MKKITKLLFSLIVGVGLFSTTAQAKQTLHWSELSEVQTLDPAQQLKIKNVLILRILHLRDKILS